MVKQRTKNDCGIAAVANATGQTYKAVKEKFGKVDRGGMKIHELDWLLEQFAEWKKVRRPRKDQSAEAWAKKHKTGRYILYLNVSFLQYEGHAVAVVDGDVLGHHAEHWPVRMVWKIEKLL